MAWPGAAAAAAAAAAAGAAGDSGGDGGARSAQRRPGLIFGVFLTWLFGARFLIEFVKNDQVAREATMTLNLGQQLSIPFIIIGIGLIIWAMKHPKVPLTLSRSQLPPQSKK